MFVDMATEKKVKALAKALTGYKLGQMNKRDEKSLASIPHVVLFLLRLVCV